MWQELKIQVTGTGLGLLMHNKQLADPLNEFTQALKKVSSKRKKTEADHTEMARLEFMGGLYLDEKGRPVAPADWFEATLLAAAKKKRMGPIVKAAVFCEDDALLKFAGPTKVDKRIDDPECQLRVAVRVQQARVMRTRPLFLDWSCTAVLKVDTAQINMQEVIELVELAGQQAGIGDWRPKYGRFDITVMSKSFRSETGSN
ncbi:hypothetical protein LCGC14_0709370 [marine sediment metagenome]|uniref:Uncharacterized protein n=1 Tax=marine sediment metagenome TaxID=412755 RepID=A0A0F9QFI2_9ZZZZ